MNINQPNLVAAEIRVKIAEGQKAQAAVLGKDKVMQLAILEKVLNATVANPNIVKIPSTLVTGTSGGREGAAAILGASNIGMGIGQRPPEKAKK